MSAERNEMRVKEKPFAKTSRASHFSETHRIAAWVPRHGEEVSEARLVQKKSQKKATASETRLNEEAEDERRQKDTRDSRHPGEEASQAVECSLSGRSLRYLFILRWIFLASSAKLRFMTQGRSL